MEDEIRKTRSIGLGSSDAKMVYRIGELQQIPEAAKQRLAIMLGLEKPKSFSNAATETGHFIENELFQVIKNKHEDAVSNPYNEITGSIFDKMGFKVFNHIDFEIRRRTITWFECKATQDSLEETIRKYSEQLQWHHMILSSLNKDTTMGNKLYLVHYHVDGYDNHEFTDANLSIVEVDKQPTVINTIKKGLKIISDEIKDFKYESKEELGAYCLPEKEQQELESVSFAIKEIQKYKLVEENFKKNILKVMLANDIKNIKTEFFNITAIDVGDQIKFDTTRFKKERPLVYKKYLKKSSRSAHVKIKVK